MRTTDGWRMLIVVAGLGTGLTSQGAGQCQTAAPPVNPRGGVTIPTAPTPVPLGVKPQGNGTTLSATWNNVAGACNYTVQWWAPGQTAASAPQTQVPVPAPGTTTVSWSSNVTMSPGTYTMRVSAGLGGGKFGFNDVTFQVAAQLQVVTALPLATAVPPGAARGAPPAPAPTGLAVSGITPASAKVRWNATPGATGHTVQRMTASAAPCASAGPTPVTGTTWQDDGTHFNCSYTYRLTASFAGGGTSFVDQAYTPPRPVNPYNFMAVQNADGSVTLSWAPVSGASYYMLHGPRSGSSGLRVNGTTQKFSAVPAGIQTWRLITYYDPGAVADPPSASKATLEVKNVVVASNPPASTPAAPPGGTTTPPPAPPMTCNDNNPATRDLVVNGVCSYQNLSAGTACSPPVGGIADGNGKCAVPPAPVICNDNNPATNDVVVNGVCSYQNLAAGASCSPPVGGIADGNGKCAVPPAPQPAAPPAVPPPAPASVPPTGRTGVVIPTGPVTLTPVTPPPAPPAAINPRGGIPLAPGGQVSRRGTLPAAAGPASVSVTGTPATATVSWAPVAGVASYTVVRQEQNVAPATVAALPASSSTYTDQQVHPASPYTYVVNAIYPNGTQGSASGSVVTPDAVNPTNFIAKETSPGTVQFTWTAAATPYTPTEYMLLEPGNNGSATSVGLGTSFTLTTVRPGNHAWMLASYYNPSGIQGAAVSTSATKFPTFSLNVTAPAMSGHYLITVTGIRSVQASADDMLSRDGQGDEIFASAFVRQYDRNTGQVAMFTALQTMTYGDSRTTGRIQAGSYQPYGGIRDGDQIPTGGTFDRQDVPQASQFPWKLWDGTLTDRADAVIISPSIWEVDGNPAQHYGWVQQQQTLNPYLLASPLVKAQLQSNAFKYLTYGGAEIPGGLFQSRAGGVVADAALAMIGLPPLGSLFAGTTDRPIGVTMVNGGTPGSVGLPNKHVVLTREIIEAALNMPAAGSIYVNGYQIYIPKSGIMAIEFVDAPSGGLFVDRPAFYIMFLQVERCPCS